MSIDQLKILNSKYPLASGVLFDWAMDEDITIDTSKKSTFLLELPYHKLRAILESADYMFSFFEAKFIYIGVYPITPINYKAFVMDKIEKRLMDGHKSRDEANWYSIETAMEILESRIININK